MQKKQIGVPGLPYLQRRELEPIRAEQLCSALVAMAGVASIGLAFGASQFRLGRAVAPAV